MLVCRPTSLPDAPITGKLGLICGTSTCHMAISEQPLFVDGVWGPYFSAMVPGMTTDLSSFPCLYLPPTD